MEQLDKTTQSLLEGKSMIVHMIEDGQIKPKIVARLAMHGFPRSEYSQLAGWHGVAVRNVITKIVIKT